MDFLKVYTQSLMLVLAASSNDSTRIRPCLTRATFRYPVGSSAWRSVAILDAHKPRRRISSRCGGQYWRGL